MPEAELAALLGFFNVLANESRLRIVGLLAQGERSVQELATLLDLKEPTVSHHLAALKALGLVTVRAQGVTRWHALNLDALAEMNRALLETKNLAAPPPSQQTWEEKTLAGYLEPDGRLKAIPASRRKRVVILKWLTRMFEEGRSYPEKALNAVLLERHWDSATLRREMIGHKMMVRENGVYWRLPEDGWEG